ncbi:MAG: hypothetical protein WKF82_05030 [Nocardioidaceae bacterium]
MVDDHELSRRGLVILLGAEADIDVVAELDKRASLTRVRATAPDVIVVTLGSPNHPADQVRTAIRTWSDAAPVLLLTPSTSEPNSVDPALLATAAGSVSADASVEHVAELIRSMVDRQDPPDSSYIADS